MNINQIFELSMVLDSEKFHKILTRAYDRTDGMEKNGDEHTDHSLSPKGITVMYRDSQYKKKVKVIINSGALLDGKAPEPERLVWKMNKRICGYFGSRYKLEDFQLSGVALVMDINVGDSEMVSAYLKVLQRIGKVKGFSQVEYECFHDDSSFCMEGNSNGIEFLLYDLKELFRCDPDKADITRKALKSLPKKSEGVLRTEVWLTKPKAIREHTRSSDLPEQIGELAERSMEVFIDVFTGIIPYGDFYKKDKAVEIIHRKVEDSVMRRKMLRLLTLIPEKKSLYLAQKAMNCRNIDKVMESFMEINLSPVTISKRHDIKYLDCIYKNLLGDK